MAKLGVITDGISRDLEHALQVATEHDLEYAELQFVWDKEVGDLDDDQMATALALVDKYGVKVSSITRHNFVGLLVGAGRGRRRRPPETHGRPAALHRHGQGLRHQDRSDHELPQGDDHLRLQRRRGLERQQGCVGQADRAPHPGGQARRGQRHHPFRGDRKQRDDHLGGPGPEVHRRHGLRQPQAHVGPGQHALLRRGCLSRRIRRACAAATFHTFT